MSSYDKVFEALHIIMDELNVPDGSSLGDVMWYLSAVDEDNEIYKMFRTLVKNAVVDQIKTNIKLGEAV